jgi:hypothetical protein
VGPCSPSYVVMKLMPLLGRVMAVAAAAKARVASPWIILIGDRGRKFRFGFELLGRLRQAR